MLTGIHFLLTLECNFECDHCFLFCGPHAGATFTLSQVKDVFSEIEKIGAIDNVYFEGGEPFIYYPIMLEGIKMARRMNLDVGIVTNAYFATSEEDAEIWLRPIVDMGISYLSLSDDAYHGGEDTSPAKIAHKAAEKLGLPVGSICIEEPRVEMDTDRGEDKGEPVIGGDVLFKGRAAEKLTEGLPTKNWRKFDCCPAEELEHPKRVHIDALGNVHICQGLSMGNMWKTPLSELVSKYDCKKHPICKHLVDGGPAKLSETYNAGHSEEHVSECHFCYYIRKSLIEKFPEYLAPKQVYGLT